MPDYGLTDEGFHRKRYADVISDMNDRARDLFGENVNLTAASPLGIFLRIIAWSISKAWQVAEAVYNAGFVDTAEGTSLDHVGKYIGITRRPAERATGIITITGDENTTVPEGFLVATEEDVEFETTQEVTIPVAGEVDADIQAVEPGSHGNVEAATITEIITVIEGVTSVSNAEPTDGGREQETDADFRARYYDSIAKPGASTVDSIRAALLDIPEIIAAEVIENVDDETDADGRPPKSFESYILGVNEDAVDVGMAILRGKAGGIQAYGTESVTVQDEADNDVAIGYTEATEITIYVDVTLTTTPEFPDDGQNKVEKEIIRYIGGTDADGDFHVGLSMGDDVIYTQVIQRVIAAADGIADVAVELSDDNTNWYEANIVIDKIEAAHTAPEHVAVTTE